MAQILLVEDEPKVSAFIVKGLEEYGHKAELADDGAKALNRVCQKGSELIIMDLMLPDISGVDLCRMIRRENTNVPILILSALNSVDYKVNGLQAGADDYMVKPFHFSELLARVDALLRRSGKAAAPENVLKFQDLTLDPGSKTAYRGNTEIALTAKEYALLELFMQHPNRLLSREFIAEKVWNIEFDTGTNFIDVYITYLRKKVDKGFQQRLIHTVIGMGYIMKVKKDED
ncbi:response regulator transcription factor [Mucilaginibacter sp. RS28]|uniref:Response regulator transcription factor n=1 Tax=Mucilaginibacter straminoryzae TaxID=2932774 RepID=A0A9X1X317_9SPHI|nr:response regulator transcription factor [Mucilaginibacter straminoryzae]MCJ8210342.1 response regulator transcription factor [Mucilaginibacter straminoryzae]